MNTNCEYCNKPITIIIGSGRFCSKQCARGFSTKAKRALINVKVSNKLSGKTAHLQTEKSREKRRKTMLERYGTCGVFIPEEKKIETYLKISNALKNRAHQRNITLPFEKISYPARKRLVLEQQQYKCISCNNSDWLGKLIPLELDHIDGNTENNARENLRGLCPNCHAFTATYRGKNIDQTRKGSISNNVFLESLKTSKNIRAALIKLKIAPYGGNYKRATELVVSNNITFA